MPTNLVGTMKDLAVVQLVSGKNFPAEGELTFTAFWGKKDAVRIDAVKSSIDQMDIHEEFAFPTNMLDERLLMKEHVELFCIYTSPTGTKLNIGSIKIPVSTITLQEKWYHFTNGSNTFMVDVPSVLVSSYIECDLDISNNLEVEKAKFVRTSVNFTGDVNFNSDLDEISIVEDCDGQKALSSSNGKRLGVTFALDETQDSDNVSFPTKTNKRRRIHSISGSDSDDSVIVEYQGKKRRKLDYLDIASDDEDDVLVMETRHQVDKAVKMRKNINPILNEGNLQDDTKIAAKEEEERKKRLAERKKIYDTISPENSLDKNLILDFDLTTKEALVSVHPHLVSRLKAHQLKGVKFMWDSCFESLERVDGHPGSGCILAHCMGLGKSLQVVTLVHTVLTHEACQVKRVAVVCPVSTLFNWVNEFTIWLPGDLKLKTYELTDSKTYAERVSVLRQWFSKGGVLIIGYEMYRNLSNRDNEKIDGQLRSTFRHLLIDPGPDLIICDEGHLMKNDGSTLSISMNQISTRRRIILTGTPLQNNLLEYHCMVDFVKPFLLGTKKEFVNRFVNPINNGQAADSNDDDVRLMKRRAHVLHNLLKESVQRLDYTILTPHLPPKYEYVIAVKMSDLQVKLYRHYLKYHSRGGPKKSGRGKGAGLFADFQELSRVWTHPKAMLLSEIRQMGIGKESTASFTPSALFGSIVGDSGNGGDLANDDGWKGRTRRSRGDKPPPKDQLGVTAPMSAPWWFKFVRDEDVENMALSGKLLLLMDILQNCEQLSEKILVFSQSLMTLDVIEEFLAAQQRQQQSSINKNKSSNTEKILGTWIRDKDYFRLDGNCATDLRKTCCDAFNDPSNLRSRLFLISTKAGGLGINLVAANRVIIFDASWNPSHDVQSIFRIYRFGQKKPCYVYRFLAQGTMEEKIYDRQVNKQSLSCRVVDEQQVKRHFNRKDLEDLYAFDGTIKPRRPVLPSTIKDSILIKLLAHRGKDWIATFHEHDSLLENKTEEELDEGERKAAWDDYKNQDAMSTLVP